MSYAYGLRAGAGVHPPNVAAALGRVELTDDQKALDAKLAKLGVAAVATISYPTCPQNKDSWVVQKGSWPECEQKLGMRWRTPEGWCYPTGLCGIEGADPQTQQLALFRKVELYQLLMGALNAAKEPKRDAWLLKKARTMILNKEAAPGLPVPQAQTRDVVAKARSDGSYGGDVMELRVTKGRAEDWPAEAEDYAGFYKMDGGYTNKTADSTMPTYDQMTSLQRSAFADMTNASMPADIRHISTATLMKTQTDMHEQLRAMAKAQSSTSDEDVHIARLVQALRASGETRGPAGEPLETYARTYYRRAVACADASIGKEGLDASNSCTTGASKTYKDAAGADQNAVCAFVDDGEDGKCLPKEFADDKDEWTGTGAKQAPLADWYSEILNNRTAKRVAEVAAVKRALGGYGRAGGKRVM